MMTLLTSRALKLGVASTALLVAACAETQLGAQAVKEVVRSDAGAEAAPELAPEAFDATGLTIWDGASTLEGVWIAHPLAQRAQRVRVINTENDISIEGAMFRRDPTLSGPSILVSSDAARRLGLQPGLPTELRIIALREGVFAQPQTDNQAGAVETAALPAPESAAEPAEPAADSAEPAPETTEPVEAPAAIEQPAEPETVETAQASPPAESAAEDPAPEREVQRPKNAITAEDLVAADEGDSASTAGATAAPADATPSPAAETPAPAADPAPAPEPTVAAAPEPAAPAPSSSGAYQGELPNGLFVQAGAFSVEPNAAALVSQLRSAGQPAQYVQRVVNGTLFNIVMIGPLANEADADAASAAAAKAGVNGARKIVR